MQSMTGFGSAQANVKPFGKVNIEIRSTNHKFLESSVHLPEGMFFLEEKIKREIESRVKRGRVICSVNLSQEGSPAIFVNHKLVKSYLREFSKVKTLHGIKDSLSINTLVGLPGVISYAQNNIAKANIWPKLHSLLCMALDRLDKTRGKEGKALSRYLKNKQEILGRGLSSIKERFRSSLREKLKNFTSDEERASFLKSSDISEEIERLSFHIGNFRNKILRSGPLGKELDFIAQEMQRETNTLAAKSFSVAISAKVVQIKSTIEKIREQVQNIE